MISFCDNVYLAVECQGGCAAWLKISLVYNQTHQNLWIVSARIFATLDYFLAVAEHQGFTRAAEALCIFTTAFSS